MQRRETVGEWSRGMKSLIIPIFRASLHIGTDAERLAHCVSAHGQYEWRLSHDGIACQVLREYSRGAAGDRESRMQHLGYGR